MSINRIIYKTFLILGAISVILGSAISIHAQNLVIANTIMTLEEQDTFLMSANSSNSFYVGDTLRTDSTQKLPVIFVNGNIIRLMPLSELQITKFSENHPIKREFEAEYVLKSGTAVFLITANNAGATIKTPNVTITGLSNSLLTVSIAKELTSVSVSVGQPIIENRLHRKQIYPGQYVPDIGYTLNFTEDIQLAKFFIVTKTDSKFLEWDTAKQENLGFSGQLIEQATGENTNQSYPVYLYSNLFGGQIANNNVLNEHGFTFQEININSIEEYIKSLRYIYFVYLPDEPAHLSTVGKPVFLEVKDVIKTNNNQ